MSEGMDWTCPHCDEEHWDFHDQHTHCRKCGRVFLIGRKDGEIWDEGYNIEVDNAEKQMEAAQCR